MTELDESKAKWTEQEAWIADFGAAVATDMRQRMAAESDPRQLAASAAGLPAGLADRLIGESIDELASDAAGLAIALGCRSGIEMGQTGRQAPERGGSVLAALKRGFGIGNND